MAKNKFEQLDEDFRTLIENGTEEQIRAKLAEVALAEHENQVAKKSDEDLAEKKDAAKLAGEQYAEATKTNKLRIAYAYFILESRGKL
jgi:hypothetical protein